MALIHILEQDTGFAARAEEALARRGHETLRFCTPHEFFYQLSRLPPVCAVVNWMLPEMTGLDVVSRIRQQLGARIGIVMLSASGCEDRAIHALRYGADDFLVKPANHGLLAAHVDALLRRLVPAKTLMTQRVEQGPYTLDLRTRTATLEGRNLQLAPREFDLAWTLFSQPSRLFTMAELLAAIWGRNTAVSHHTVTQHIHALRKKMALAAHGGALLSVYGAGYRLEWAAAGNADTHAEERHALAA